MILFLWILMGIMTAVIAGSKNRNWFGWLIVGFLIGIFGLILIACMPKLEGKSE